MGAYSTPEHHGTHLDAPIHAAEDQPSVDQLTAADLFGPAAVIDVAAQCQADPDYRLTKDDLLAWEAQHGNLPDGAIVLMYTGWSKKWSDYEAYKNQDAEGRMHFPGFSEEAARFLIDERQIKGIGIDNLSVDAGARIQTEGILGGRYVSIVLGAEDEYLVDGDTITETQGAFVLENLIGELVTRMGN